MFFLPFVDPFLVSNLNVVRFHLLFSTLAKGSISILCDGFHMSAHLTSRHPLTLPHFPPLLPSYLSLFLPACRPGRTFVLHLDRPLHFLLRLLPSPVLLLALPFPLLLFQQQ